MGETIRVKSAVDGFEFEAYRASVSDARRGGLVICHAITGVTPHLMELADGYAEDGYETLVPSLFDRYGRGFAKVDFDPAVRDRQMEFGERSDWGANIIDAVQASIDALKAPVFILGFCYGGTVAWLAAARCTGVAAVSSFYGGHIPRFIDDTPKVPIALHFGKTDPWVPPQDVELIRQRHPDVPVHLYEGGHGFVHPGPNHQADSTRLALLRTKQLFARSAGRGEI